VLQLFANCVAFAFKRTKRGKEESVFAFAAWMRARLQLASQRLLRGARDFLSSHSEFVKSFVLVVVFLGVTTLFISATVSLVGLSIALVERSDITLDLEQYLTSSDFPKDTAAIGQDFMLEQIQIEHFFSELNSQQG